MKRNRRLRIGTRGSELALWQARWVQTALQAAGAGLASELEIIRTTGDKVLDTPLARIGDKGLFTREIEHALLERRIDVAVHSLKDLPTELPAGLALGGVTEREDPRDVFIPHPANPIRSLREQPHGARIATGSLRRKCQMLHLRPDFAVVDLRGNLATRFKKLQESDWHGMVLARAGVVRLGWDDRIGEVLPADVMLPAVGQGALGLEIRADDAEVREMIGGLVHEPTRLAVLAERALLRTLEGGCQVPIGTHARLAGDRLVMDAIVGSLDGHSLVRGYEEGPAERPEELGQALAGSLLAQGADAILRSIRSRRQDVNTLEG